MCKVTRGLEFITAVALVVWIVVLALLLDAASQWMQRL